MAAFGTGVNPALGRIDYTPYLQGSVQGSAAIGQGIANLGQGIGAAIKEYSQNKEMRDLLTQNNETQAQKALAISEAFKKNPQLFGNVQPFSDKTLQDLKNMPNMSMGKLKALNAELNASVTKYEPVLINQAQQENIRNRTFAAQQLTSTGMDPFAAALQAGLPADKAQSFATGFWQNRETASQISENISKASLRSADRIFPSQADLEGRYPSDQYDYNFVPNPDGTVTVVGGKISPRAPSPSSDSQYMVDPTTGKTVPKPGTEAFAKKQDAEIKWNRSLASQKEKAANIVSVINKAKNQANSWTAGLLGKTLSSVSGTSAYDLRANLDTILANLGFDQLQELRMNSPTGGALGNVSATELNSLQSAFRNLSNSQSPQQLIENLDAVYSHYQNALSAIEAESMASDEEILKKYLPK